MRAVVSDIYGDGAECEEEEVKCRMSPACRRQGWRNAENEQRCGGAGERRFRMANCRLWIMKNEHT